MYQACESLWVGCLQLPPQWQGFGSRFHRPELEREKMVSCCNVGEFAKVIARHDGLSASRVGRWKKHVSIWLKHSVIQSVMCLSCGLQCVKLMFKFWIPRLSYAFPIWMQIRPEGSAPHRVPSVSIMNSIKNMHIGIIKLALYWQLVPCTSHLSNNFNRSKNVKSIDPYKSHSQAMKLLVFWMHTFSASTWATAHVIWFDDLRWQHRDQNIKWIQEDFFDRPLGYQHRYARNVVVFFWCSALDWQKLFTSLYYWSMYIVIVHVHCCSNCQARGLELFAASSAVHLCSLRQTTR